MAGGFLMGGGVLDYGKGLLREDREHLNNLGLRGNCDLKFDRRHARKFLTRDFIRFYLLYSSR